MRAWVQRTFLVPFWTGCPKQEVPVKVTEIIQLPILRTEVASVGLVMKDWQQYGLVQCASEFSLYPVRFEHFEKL